MDKEYIDAVREFDALWNKAQCNEAEQMRMNRLIKIIEGHESHFPPVLCHFLEEGDR